MSARLLIAPGNTVNCLVHDIEMFVMLWPCFQMEGFDPASFFRVPAQLTQQQARLLCVIRK